MSLEKHIREEWVKMVNEAKCMLITDCPLIEDEVMFEVDCHLQKVEDLLEIAIEAVCEAGYEGYDNKLKAYIELNTDEP